MPTPPDMAPISRSSVEVTKSPDKINFWPLPCFSIEFSARHPFIQTMDLISIEKGMLNRSSIKLRKLLSVCFYNDLWQFLTSISIEVSQKIVHMIKRKQIKSFSWSIFLLNIALNQSDLSKLNWTVKQFIFI